MCGIAVLLQSAVVPVLPSWPFWGGTTKRSVQRKNRPIERRGLLEQLKRRGPDSVLQESLSLSSNCNLDFIQTILSHQGELPQSLRSNTGNVFLFNGEVYQGLLSGEGGDREAFSTLLNEHCDEEHHLDHALLKRLDALRGPWTFIFWHHKARRLYFARDVLGRRSLLIRVVEGQSLELVSIPPCNDCDGFVEVPPVGLAYLEFSSDGHACFGLVPREKSVVVPRRVEDERDEAIVSGSAKHMYVSFLPKHWLRSLDSSKAFTEMNAAASAERFLMLFRKSIRRRLITRREYLPGHYRYAVLFSGGIDSLVMAAILDECLPQHEDIALLNVAFGENSIATEQCPDRVTALSGMRELQSVCKSNRHFELVCVDIAPTTADKILNDQVRHLVHPCDQPMDASIGTAIWAAASANGCKLDTKGYHPDMRSNGRLETAKTPYSEARILFSGLGADELMGGYKGRHRTIFRTEGIEGILREMDADLSRLWFRNLGRDDRLIADHGKEVRHPYLDEDLIDYVSSLQLVEHVCDLSKPDGVGDKHLLRRAAQLIGFSQEVTSRSKRAIQFGSRSKHVIERKRQ